MRKIFDQVISVISGNSAATTHRLSFLEARLEELKDIKL